MAVPNGSVEILITCGQTAVIRKFNEQTNIGQIHAIVRQEFRSNLLHPYRIMYYDTTTQSFVDLEDQLRNGINPFQLNPTIGVEDAASPPENIRLYVVNRSPSNSRARSPIDDQIVFDSTSSDTQSEPYLSVPSNPANDDASQENNEYLSDSTQDLPSQTIPHLIVLQNKSERLSFSLDVKPKQRHIYRSDEFNIRGTKSNGRIARVQGIKKEDKKMLQVLPRLRIPAMYIQSNATLLVMVVLERLVDGMRIWYKHPHKGFLPENYTKDSQMINPISYDLNNCRLSENGDMPLSLPMITKWDKTQRELEEFHRLDQKRTMELHPASNVEQLPRLICVIRQDGVTDWNTFCLSDFIRPTKQPKQKSSSVSRERSSSPQRKRKKTK